MAGPGQACIVLESWGEDPPRPGQSGPPRPAPLHTPPHPTLPCVAPPRGLLPNLTSVQASGGGSGWVLCYCSRALRKLRASVLQTSSAHFPGLKKKHLTTNPHNLWLSSLQQNCYSKIIENGNHIIEGVWLSSRRRGCLIFNMGPSGASVTWDCLSAHYE